MAAQTGISLEQYLSTSYEGVDREYVDGEVVERTMPNFIHGFLQVWLGMFFMNRLSQWGLYASSETRLRMPEDNVRIPALAVFDHFPGKFPATPPALVVEILSDGDHPGALMVKLREYTEFGVPNIWVIDPETRSCFEFDGALRQVTTLRIKDREIALEDHELFAILDRQ